MNPINHHFQNEVPVQAKAGPARVMRGGHRPRFVTHTAGTLLFGLLSVSCGLATAQEKLNSLPEY